MKNTDELNIVDTWNIAIDHLRGLSRDSRLSGLASGYVERAALEMEKISQQGIEKTPRVAQISEA